MAKFFGTVGYAVTGEKEEQPGVWEDTIIERKYYGDTIKMSTRWITRDKVNDDLTVNNQISILADGFAYQNFSNIKYVEWMGVKWKVTNIEVSRPRLVLTLGGEYNG